MVRFDGDEASSSLSRARKEASKEAGKGCELQAGSRRIITRY